jgi:hypothetical protein
MWATEFPWYFFRILQILFTEFFIHLFLFIYLFAELHESCGDVPANTSFLQSTSPVLVPGLQHSSNTMLITIHFFSVIGTCFVFCFLLYSL